LIHLLPFLFFLAAQLLPVRVLEAAERPQRVSERNSQPVMALLDSGQPEDQIWAARVLGEMGRAAEAAAPALIRVIRTGTPEARVVASIALVKVDPYMKDFIPILLQALEKQAAGETSAPAATELEGLKTLGLQEDALAKWAALTKREIDPWIMPLLFQELRAEDADVRTLVLLVLGDLSLKAPQAFDYLVRGLQDPDPAVRVSVVGVLERIAPAKPEAVREIGRAFRDPDKSVRARALVAVARVGRDSAEILPTLQAALKDPEEEVRRTALFALGRLGVEARSAADSIREGLKSESRKERLDACAALLKIHPAQEGPHVMPVLAAVAAEQAAEPHVRVQALDLLALAGPEGVRAVPTLVDLLGEKEPQVRTRAMEVMGRLGPQILPEVERSLASPNGTVRVGAVQVLLSLPTDQMGPIPLLIRALQDEDRSVRYLAAEGLARLGSQAHQAVPDLINTLRDPEERVRTSAGNALIRVGPLAVPALEELSRGQDPVLQSRAEALLKRMRER